MIAIAALVVARMAFVVAVASTVAFTTRKDRSTPSARRLRSIALWAVAVGVLGIVVFAVAE